MTWPADSAVVNSGISARSHMATRRSGAGLIVGHDDDRRLQRHDARDASVQHVAGGLAQIADFAPPHDLDAIGVDVVQVADQVGGRLRVAQRGFVEAALRMGVTRDPLQRRASRCSSNSRRR
ncbi:hypothetical protein Ddc_23762 [Ditylenchus destructor]|nr:hypothetical protein Ddc_23762 [Ditylenchus destructor]